MSKLSLNELREEIDRVDESMIELLRERLELSERIAEIKKEQGIPVLDLQRQRDKRNSFISKGNESTEDYYRRLYDLLANISRDWQYRKNSASRDKYALVGKGLRHSRSAELHELLGDYDYRTVNAENIEELEAVLRDERFKGFNITSPYKQAVIPMLDELSKDAELLNAVNTIKRMPDGRLVGYNTDLYGFRYLVARDVEGRKAAVLGTGGAALAAAEGLKRLGAEPVMLVSRDPEAATLRLGDGYGIISYDELSEHRDITVIVNATPVGMYPENYASPLDGTPVNLRRMKKLELAIDLIYNPYRTKFLQDVERCAGYDNSVNFVKMLGGYKVYAISGLDMLIRQGIKARDIWLDCDTDAEAEDAEAKRIKRAMLGSQLNIITIGMPGSGKSSISRRIAKELGYPYIDTDRETEDVMGDRIDRVIVDESRGEDYFRGRETEVLREYCKRSASVIATGGGSVLRPENRDYIKGNSLVVHIKRPTAQLSQKNRPISQSEGVDKLYRERAGIYRRVADITVTNDSVFGGSKDYDGEQNSYIYDIKRFAYLIIRKAGQFLDEVVNYQWSQYESAEHKRAQHIRK